MDTSRRSSCEWKRVFCFVRFLKINYCQVLFLPVATAKGDHTIKSPPPPFAFACSGHSMYTVNLQAKGEGEIPFHYGMKPLQNSHLDWFTSRVMQVLKSFVAFSKVVGCWAPKSHWTPIWFGHSAALAPSKMPAVNSRLLSAPCCVPATLE